MSNNNTLRYAIVGAAKAVGPRHVEALARLEGAEIVALVDIPANADEAAALARTHCPDAMVFGSQQELHESGLEVDVEIIATPTFLHVEMAERAMRAGHDVAIEKPFAANAEETRQIFDLAHELGRKVYALMQRRFMLPGAADMIARGGIGAPTRTTSQWLRADVPPPFAVRAERGVFADLGIHELSLLHALLGFALPTAITGRAWYADEFRGEVAARALVDFGDISALIEVSWATHHLGGAAPKPSRDLSRFELQGSEATLIGTLPTWESPEEAIVHAPGTVRWTVSDERPVRSQRMPVLSVPEAHDVQHAELRDWLLAGVEPSIQPLHVLALMEVIDGFYASIANGGVTVYLV